MKLAPSRKSLVLGSVIVFANFVCFYKTSLFHFNVSCDHVSVKILRKIRNPPQLTESQARILTDFSGKDKQTLANQLSLIVQSQIDMIQSPSSCDSPNILCGHFEGCGFGCQVHHRVACLMISYALSLPLIHDEEKGWPFSKKWSYLFKPLGSSCVPGNNTFRWTWRDTSPLYRGTPCLFSSETSDQIEYPLHQGLPVAKALGDLVEKIHHDPFLWWVGQFMKFALKPNKYLENIIEVQKKAIGISHPIVGLHIRRTDKIYEAPDSHHEIDQYFMAAHNLLDKNYHLNSTHYKNVFIASDDSQVLPNARRKHTDWTVKGFLANRTLRNGNARVDAFAEIARDVLILSECDYIVCGLTSNICRLLYELLNSKYLDSQQRLVSLDGTYGYVLQGHTIHHPVIIKLESREILLEEGP